MEEMHKRLVVKYRHPRLFDLMDFYWETEQNLTDKFKSAETTEEKDTVMMELIQKFVKKAKELDVDDTTMMMAYIGVIKS